MALLLQSQGPCPGKRAPFLSSNIYAFLSHLKDYTPGVLTGWLLESLQQNAVFLWALCCPDLSINHRERKSVALWSEPCEIPSSFKPSLTPLACAHWHSFLSLVRTISPSLIAPLILYLWFSRTLSFLLQSLTGPLARSVMLLQWPWKINPVGELSTGVRSFWHLLPIGSA